MGFNLSWPLGALATGEVQRRMERGRAGPEQFAALVAAVDSNQGLYRHLPLWGLPELAGLARYYDQWLAHPTYDDFWRSTAPREFYSQVKVPAPNMGGWYDLFLKGTLANYVGMKQDGGSEVARRQQRLIIGPWAHGSTTGWFPQRGYGMMSGAEAADITGIQLNWFDSQLRALRETFENPPVRLFVMGQNVWRDEADSPLPDTQYVNYFLRSDGGANTATGDGTLSTKAPEGEPPDVYLYNPAAPVPTAGGPTFLPGLTVGVNSGPRDQRSLETRPDVLCYTSAPLEDALEVTGPLELVLHVSSSAPDTDFTGKLVDVHPDGRAEILADEILRARYRNSLSSPTPLVPGRVHQLTVDLVATSDLFFPGHRIRLEVSSSNFPRFDRNTNTGGLIAREGTGDLRRAVNEIHHSASHPSRLVLPVIRR